MSVAPGTGQVWEQADAYHGFIGRWSSLIAAEFVDWLEVPAGARWLDVGCGTGALSAQIIERARPSAIVGVDSSPNFVAAAAARLGDRFDHAVADAAALPFDDGEFDAVVSGLVLNFIAVPGAAAAEQARVSRGIVAAYVWDYAERMELLKLFWDAAGELAADASQLDEARRFPLAQPDALARLFDEAGLSAVEVRAIDVPARFADFDDLWSPFLGGQGPGPAYVATLDESKQASLRERLRERLPIGDDGTIELTAGAWAVRGRVSAGG
jgi:SAM-dependent methyltransferase